MDGILKRLGEWGGRLRARAKAHLSILLVFTPIVLLALLLAAYGWWWRIVADGVRQSVADFQTAQLALGREVKWEALSVAGFPYRVEATILQPHFTAPDRGAAADGERIVVQAQPFALNRVGFSLEGQQHFFYAKEGRWIEAYARADKALVNLASTRESERAGFEIERLTGKLTVDATDVNVIADEATGQLSVSGATVDEPLAQVDLTGRLKNIALQGKIDFPLGRTIAGFEIDAGAKLGALSDPSAAAAVAAWRATGTPVQLRRLELEWGGVHVSASGEFKLDAASLPEGRFMLKIGNHPRVLELLEAYGWITKEKRELAKQALDVLAFFSGDPERRVAVPLRIEKGVVTLALVPIATLAPPAAAAQLQAPVEPPAP